ncbi:hypothetical protein A2962_02595 [Candidatus Woesebacteria bacterium RIFCSPLOWO2_01_FULL_39_61]|uniref:Phosphoesterase HXTX domain-containing protein n=1 Tax=Candidatus Woesebacteria bacterium RIFCSPHIGHO2_02_FULL_39_13 TaxID=1802505 RepID=A0A1F7Z5E1_9BACT|nr:MAG: hypothetical protein A2692_02915 [Candidatus Woesebacteria bacterium RIFCSPHIGHO2_01_FULL_39_95]OGM34684.1 MAG: hypothetical protein A3D01_04120 [Candidatus Woesebacteria bacterium RIFCSPHIGHO2_02_FULL_39_13]OGM38693.1 MAG: hypothetical protein A3E13_04495 [Candidatus Woesebacteria bacterium RIFCSPHIGHO2_12_FULL_40_20]OGM67227.1 MAG: hypothetical protein A2962_02595 [Candidatus Woesebacteria bacterium RIFCSPLOWO2_01_FULL_39_61]OGM75415.1 MAG: hypothetical protein A3H19_03560 [Candidatus
MLRVFVGIKISQKLKKEITNWQALHKRLAVRWIEEDNIHLTLVPPWYVHSNEVENIIRDLEMVKNQTQPFIIQYRYLREFKFKNAV